RVSSVAVKTALRACGIRIRTSSIILSQFRQNTYVVEVAAQVALGRVGITIATKCSNVAAIPEISCMYESQIKYSLIFNYQYSGNTLLTTRPNVANTVQFAFDINFGARGRRYGVAHGSERQMKTAVGAKLRQPRVDQGVTTMKYLVARFVKD